MIERITNIRGWQCNVLSVRRTTVGLSEQLAFGKANPGLRQTYTGFIEGGKLVLFAFSIPESGACSRLFSAGPNAGSCGSMRT
jgi:hypothetical protein